MNEKIFKAYDIRGQYPREINERVVSAIAIKLPKLLGKRIVVAHDARLSSPALYKAVLKGLQHSNVLKNVRMTTTPMFYFLVNKLKASGGIMVTASHNPKNFNGLKVVGKNAKPISGKEILLLFKK
ncbi:MAG: hypothetical protein Q8P76_03680 [bacterium]|nr:hypothetical protein [bacterium]